MTLPKPLDKVTFSWAKQVTKTMANELRAEQNAQSSRAESPISNPQLLNLWSRENMKVLGTVEHNQLARTPASELLTSGLTSVKDQTLVLHGVLPDGDDLLNSLKAAERKDVIAQTVSYDGSLPTLIPDFILKAGIQIWDGLEKPLEGSEQKLMTSITAHNPQAWEDARSAFPQLAGVSPDLMKAYTLNEINHYDRFDLADDMLAASGKSPNAPGRRADQATLGLSQISPKGVAEFEEKYPQLKQFLASKGYGPGQEAKALLDPECVPMIVAAKTATIVEDLQKHGIKHPTTEQIAYGYNPDVYSYSNGHSGKEYKSLYQGDVKASQALHWEQKKEFYANNPEVLKTSAHIHNVMKLINDIGGQNH